MEETEMGKTWKEFCLYKIADCNQNQENKQADGRGEDIGTAVSRNLDTQMQHNLGEGGRGRESRKKNLETEKILQNRWVPGLPPAAGFFSIHPPPTLVAECHCLGMGGENARTQLMGRAYSQIEKAVVVINSYDCKEEDWYGHYPADGE